MRKLFYDQEGCLTYLGDDRLAGITSYDYGHLMPMASDYLAKNLLVKIVTGGALQEYQPAGPSERRP